MRRGLVFVFKFLLQPYIMEGTVNQLLIQVQQQLGVLEAEKRAFQQEMARERQRLSQANARALENSKKDLIAREEALNTREKRFAEIDATINDQQLKAQSKILLDVGGRKFSTTSTTLTAEPNSMLAAMFSGRHKLPKDDAGYYFIDRNGDHFSAVLDWLRTRELSPGLGPAQLQALKIEADYYQLESLLIAVTTAATKPVPVRGVSFRLRLALAPPPVSAAPAQPAAGYPAYPPYVCSATLVTAPL